MSSAIVLAALPIVFLLLSIYVFATAARRYVSGEEVGGLDDGVPGARIWRRSPPDRRSGAVPRFPLELGEEIIERDRRRCRERRGTATQGARDD